MPHAHTHTRIDRVQRRDVRYFHRIEQALTSSSSHLHTAKDNDERKHPHGRFPRSAHLQRTRRTSQDRGEAKKNDHASRRSRRTSLAGQQYSQRANSVKATREFLHGRTRPPFPHTKPSGLQSLALPTTGGLLEFSRCEDRCDRKLVKDLPPTII